MTRYIDMTPTWAGLMPALIACLQNGAGEGPAMAAAELTRLAKEVDSANTKAFAAIRAAAKERAAALKLEAEKSKVQAWRDGGQGGRYSDPKGGALLRAACYYEAAADLQEKEAAALLTKGAKASRQDKAGQIAFDLATAAQEAAQDGAWVSAGAFWAAADMACPEAPAALSWRREASAAVQKAYEEAAARGKAYEEAAAAREKALQAQIDSLEYDLTQAKARQGFKPPFDNSPAARIEKAIAAKIPVYWIEAGQITSPENPLFGRIEYQFSDGPSGNRSTSEDFPTLTEGLAALGPALFVPCPDLEERAAADLKTGGTL